VIGIVADHRFVTLTGTEASARRDSLSKLHGKYCPNFRTGFGLPSSRRCLIRRSSRSPSSQRSGSNSHQVWFRPKESRRHSAQSTSCSYSIIASM
jgi:hypothetical protein